MQCLSCCAPGFEVPPLLQIAGTHWRADIIPSWFLVYRFIIFVLMLWITSITMYRNQDELQWWFIELTTWNQILCQITVIVRLVSTAMIRSRYEMAPDHLFDDLQSLTSSQRRLYHFQSILSRTALPMATLVTVNYWLFVYDPSSEYEFLKNLNRIQLHGINAFLMLMDYLLSAEIMGFRSIIWPILFGTLYTIWSVIFEFTIKVNGAGDSYIYSTMDWSEEWETPLILYGLSVVVVSVITLLASCLKNCILVQQKDVFQRDKQRNSTHSEMTIWSTSTARSEY